MSERITIGKGRKMNSQGNWYDCWIARIQYVSVNRYFEVQGDTKKSAMEEAIKRLYALESRELRDGVIKERSCQM